MRSILNATYQWRNVFKNYWIIETCEEKGTHVGHPTTDHFHTKWNAIKNTFINEKVRNHDLWGYFIIWPFNRQNQFRSSMIWNPWHKHVLYVIIMTLWWTRWRFKSPASRLFAQPFIQAYIKDTITAPRHWPLWGESTGDRSIPLTKGQ